VGGGRDRLYGLTLSLAVRGWPCAAAYAELPVATVSLWGKPDDRVAVAECGPAGSARAEYSAPTLLAGVGLLPARVSREAPGTGGWFTGLQGAP